MAKPGLAARAAALAVLEQVTGKGALLDEALAAASEGLEPPERARAQRLATDTLRWADRADRMLGPHLRRRPPLAVLNLLRMSAVELFVHETPAHAAVDLAVTLARSQPRGRAMAGLVNAVARKLATDGVEAWDALPLPRLPKWLRKPLVAAYGRQVVAAIEAAHAAGAPLDLTARDGDAAALARAVDGIVLPTGSVRVPGHPQVTALPGYADGTWWVQDAAAAVPARALAASAGERVLDLCAAPGGKTLQLAAAGARVTAVDVSGARMSRLRENLARTGLAAELVVADALGWEPPAAEGFDAVLLDAPCSATGTIRRHPDLPHARDASRLPELAALQARLIDRAAALLRPGGRLVFCTCSLLPEEGEAQIAPALARNPALRTDPGALALPGIAPDWIGDEGLRLRPDYWPELGGMDGFFVGVLRKTA